MKTQENNASSRKDKKDIGPVVWVLSLLLVALAFAGDYIHGNFGQINDGIEDTKSGVKKIELQMKEFGKKLERLDSQIESIREEVDSIKESVQSQESSE